MNAMHNPKEIVRNGYDRLSVHYREHFIDSHIQHYEKWVKSLIDFLPNHPSILELGCGDGIPVALYLNLKANYWGIDISSVQIENARKHVPNGKFIWQDMTELSFPANSFNGIIAFYAIIHIPLNEQYELLEKIYHWLCPNGIFLCVVGVDKWTGTENDWIMKDLTMYWSHTDEKTYAAWFEKIGFSKLKIEFIPENNGGHSLFILTKNES